MRFPWIGGLVVVSLASLGCGDSSDGDGDGSSSTASPLTSGTTEANTADATDTPPETDTTPGTTDDGTPTTGDPPPATSTGPADSSSSDGGESEGMCPPPPPEGDACLECVHANCCTAWQACYGDEPCACVIDCHVVQGNSLGMCSNSCNLDSGLYQELYFCGQASCLGACDWDCC